MRTTAASSNHPAPLDVARCRGDFPILAQRVGGRPLVYLDNAATTQKPRTVIDRLRRYYEEENANIHRGVHALSVRATEAYEHARRRVQQFLHAAAPEEIVFVRGATEAINLVAQSFVRGRLESGDEVLISAIEHHSNIVPWQLLCAQTGARLRVAPCDDRGQLIVEEFQRLLNPRTKFVALVHVSNALGTINPVRELAALSRQAGVPVLLDGAQAVSHLPVDVQELGCDFYAFSSHKTYGPTGIGVLYGRRQWLEAMPPYQGGGEMIATVTFDQTTFAGPPARFEAGTPNIAGAIGLGAALDYIDHVGREAIAAWEHTLLAYGTAALTEIPGLRLIGTAARKAGILSFVLKGIHPHDVGTILDSQGIAVRTGHHCAQPVMQRFGVPATCRASLGLYNTRDDLDALATGIRHVQKVMAP